MSDKPLTLLIAGRYVVLDEDGVVIGHGKSKREARRNAATSPYRYGSLSAASDRPMAWVTKSRKVPARRKRGLLARLLGI